MPISNGIELPVYEENDNGKWLKVNYSHMDSIGWIAASQVRKRTTGKIEIPQEIIDELKTLTGVPDNVNVHEDSKPFNDADGKSCYMIALFDEGMVLLHPVCIILILGR